MQKAEPHRILLVICDERISHKATVTFKAIKNSLQSFPAQKFKISPPVLLKSNKKVWYFGMSGK